MTTGENGTLVDDVGMIANTECFTNVVVGNSTPMPLSFRKRTIRWISMTAIGSIPAKGSSKQNEAGIGCQCAGDFDAPAFTARERER